MGAVRLVGRKGVGVQETKGAVVGPRRRLREALLRIGGDLHAPEEHIGAEVRAALCELAAKTLGGRSCAGLVTVGGADDRAGRSLGLRLADYDVGLPEVLLRADESDLPPQVRESCPALVQEEWEAVLLLSKLVLLGLEPEAGRRADEARPHLWDAAGPARSVAAGRLCRALTAVAEHPGLHQDELTAQLRAALLDFGSRTPDNLDAVRHLAVLRGGQPGRRARLVLGRSGHACAQVLFAAEGSPVPSGVRTMFPDLRQAEWTAVLQVTGLTLRAFEAEPAAAAL